jgi:ABC-type transporter Mla subunit MlaD
MKEQIQARVAALNADVEQATKQLQQHQREIENLSVFLAQASGALRELNALLAEPQDAASA